MQSTINRSFNDMKFYLGFNVNKYSSVRHIFLMEMVKPSLLNAHVVSNDVWDVYIQFPLLRIITFDVLQDYVIIYILLPYLLQA